MGKVKGRTKSSFIIMIFLIIVTIILSYLLFDIFKSVSTEKTNKLLNESKIDELDSKLNELTIKEDNIEREVRKIDNISEEINKTKEEVFTLASKLENKIKDGNSSYKIAYLTFDDGPYYLTNSFLEVLDEYGIKGTFFTIGLDKDKCYDKPNYDCSLMYKKIVDNGHTIANHTYSHAIFNGLYASPDNFINQINIQEKLIKERTGAITNITRFPGGSSTARGQKNNIINKLREKGYGWVDWTAQNGDGGYVANKSIAWNNFVNSINEDIEVVLFHDYNNVTLSMLGDAIEYLKENNYILLPLFYESVMVNK